MIHVLFLGSKSMRFSDSQFRLGVDPLHNPAAKLFFGSEPVQQQKPRVVSPRPSSQSWDRMLYLLHSRNSLAKGAICVPTNFPEEPIFLASRCGPLTETLEFLYEPTHIGKTADEGRIKKEYQARQTTKKSQGLLDLLAFPPSKQTYHTFQRKLPFQVS